jgi:hypothetical protein
MKNTFMLLALTVSGTMAEVKVESMESNMKVQSTEEVIVQEVRSARMLRASREIRASRVTRNTRLARMNRTSRKIHYVSAKNPTFLASIK